MAKRGAKGGVTQDYTVKSIQKQQTIEWLTKIHYLKRVPSLSFAFGLFRGKVLVGVLTIGKPASNSLCIGVCGDILAHSVYELNRICALPGLDKNALSFFVSSCLRKLPNLVLVSYADTSKGHVGYIYQATNWIYTGITKKRRERKANNGRHNRHAFDTSLPLSYRPQKHRYVYFTGSKAFRKKAKQKLKYTPKPYPKGDTRKYDISHTPTRQIELF